MNKPIRTAIEDIAVPAYVLAVASVLNCDLYNGPTYYVPGEVEPGDASCFDEGAVPVDFVAGLEFVRSWAYENLSTKYVGDESGIVCDICPEQWYETGEPCPTCDGSREIKRTDRYAGGEILDIYFETCEDCDGTGKEWVEDWETYWEVSASDQSKELFGSELARMI